MLTKTSKTMLCCNRREKGFSDFEIVGFLPTAGWCHNSGYGKMGPWRKSELFFCFSFCGLEPCQWLWLVVWLWRKSMLLKTEL